MQTAVRILLQVLRPRATMRAAILVLFFLSVVLSLYLIHLLTEGVRLFGDFLDFSRSESLHHVFVEHPKFLLENLVLLLFEGLLALSVIGLLVSFVFQNLLLLHLLLLLRLRLLLKLLLLLLLLIWKNILLGQESLNLLDCHFWVLLE